MAKQKNQRKPPTPNQLRALQAHNEAIRKTLCWKRVTVSIETLASIDGKRGKASRDAFISNAVAKFNTKRKANNEYKKTH